MDNEIKELSNFLNSILKSNNLNLDLDQESKFYELVEKIKDKFLNPEHEKLNFKEDQINDLLDRISLKQKKNENLLKEFKKYIEKNK